MLRAIQIVALVFAVLLVLYGFARIDDFRGIATLFIVAFLIVGLMISESINSRKET